MERNGEIVRRIGEKIGNEGLVENGEEILKLA